MDLAMRKREAAKLKRNDYVTFRGAIGKRYVGRVRIVPKNLDDDFGIYSRAYGFVVYRNYKGIELHVSNQP